METGRKFGDIWCAYRDWQETEVRINRAERRIMRVEMVGPEE